MQKASSSDKAVKRSNTVILIKNIPYETTSTELTQRFEKHGPLARVLVPPSRTVALLEFVNPPDAKSAFKELAYRKYHGVPLFLEWAPVKVFDTPTPAALPPTTAAVPSAPTPTPTPTPTPATFRKPTTTPTSTPTPTPAVSSKSTTTTTPAPRTTQSQARAAAAPVAATKVPVPVAAAPAAPTSDPSMIYYYLFIRFLKNILTQIVAASIYVSNVSFKTKDEDLT